MKNSRSIIPLLGVLFLAFAIYLPGCKGKKDPAGTAADLTVDKKELNKNHAIEEVTEYPLPTAFEVTKLLNDAGAGYIFGLCNRVEHVDRYISQQSKALNLGIYGADLSYAATYNQSQETMQYLRATAQLIDELQISSGFNQMLVERVEQNIDNVDSLINIISDSFYHTYKHLQENDQDVLSILVMAGSWIEALYITTQIAITSQNNEEIVRIISQQDPSLNKLLDIMKPVSDNEMIVKIYDNLLKIDRILGQAGESMDKQQIEKLVDITEILRTEIIA